MDRPVVIGPQSAVESPKKVVVAGFLMAAMQLGAAITLTLGSVFLTVMAVFWTFAFLYDWGDWRMVRLAQGATKAMTMWPLMFFLVAPVIAGVIILAQS